MRNGIQSQVAGVKTVQIHMFDEVVRTVVGIICARSKKESDFFGDFRYERLLVFISRWSFEGLQRSYGTLKRRNVWRLV